MKIYTIGNPVLRKKAQKVKNIDRRIRVLVEDMFNTMETHKPQGIGLAATQVGIPLSLFVYRIDETQGVVVNPVILEGKGDSLFEEGCLSVPGVYANVHRPEIIVVRYLDLNGKTHEEELRGIKARVFQHEIDHLNGILFVDYLSSLEDVFVQEGFELPEEVIRKVQKE